MESIDIVTEIRGFNRFDQKHVWKCFEDKFEPVFCSTYGMPENCEGKHFYRIKQF